jgi:hypothetical protein
MLPLLGDCARFIASTFYARPHLRPRPQRLGAASHMMPHIVHRRIMWDPSCIVAVRERARDISLETGTSVVAGTVRSVGYSDSKLHLKRFILHLEMYCICYLESPNPSSARARRKRSTRGIRIVTHRRIFLTLTREYSSRKLSVRSPLHLATTARA